MERDEGAREPFSGASPEARKGDVAAFWVYRLQADDPWPAVHP